MNVLDAADVVNLALGALQVVLALVVLRHIGRFGRTFPWLAALMLFFLVRGIERIYTGVSDSERFGIVVDLLILLVVVLLIVGLDQTVSALRTARDEADLRRSEYDRALVDYRRLARHRLANPITAIRGSVTTLRELPDLDAETREALLRAVDEEAARLETIALDPEVASAEERGLDPQPRV